MNFNSVSRNHNNIIPLDHRIVYFLVVFNLQKVVKRPWPISDNFLGDTSTSSGSKRSLADRNAQDSLFAANKRYAFFSPRFWMINIDLVNLRYWEIFFNFFVVIWNTLSDCEGMQSHGVLDMMSLLVIP